MWKRCIQQYPCPHILARIHFICIARVFATDEAIFTAIRAIIPVWYCLTSLRWNFPDTCICVRIYQLFHISQAPQFTRLHLTMIIIIEKLFPFIIECILHVPGTHATHERVWMREHFSAFWQWFYGSVNVAPTHIEISNEVITRISMAHPNKLTWKKMYSKSFRFVFE